jgi:hypothetical protein
VSYLAFISRHLWQLKTVVFLHWCLICAVLLDSNAMLGLEHSIIFSATSDTTISRSKGRQLGPNGQSVIPIMVYKTRNRLVNLSQKLLYCRSKLSSSKRKIFNIGMVS